MFNLIEKIDMKKYIAPTTRVATINCQTMIAGSLLGFGNSGSDASGAENNGYRGWDDWDDEDYE